MGLLRYLRGDDLLKDSSTKDESRALPRPENQYPLHVGYSGTPIRTVTTQNVLAIADAFACVRALADSISTLPLKVYRRTDAGRVPAGTISAWCSCCAGPAPARPAST
jgi:phage portal protein BeeE